MHLRTALTAALFLATCSALYAQGHDGQGHRHDDRDRSDNRDSRDNNRDVTQVQKNACKPDVFRVCSWYIPNRDAITSCLHTNIDRLTPDCRAVMEGRLK